MNLFTPRDYYKPHAYPWAFQAYEIQQRMHWLPHQVPLHKDVQDWELKLTTEERSLLTQLFRFFTQGDVDVAAAYRDRYSQWFKHPEISMFLWAAGASEANHVASYSLLLDTIGMPETEYKAFHEIEQMRAKHDYLFGQRGEGLSEIGKKILDIAVFSAFSEGMQLFSSFVILMSFQPRGLMNGMTTIVEWSIRDESHHVETMTKLYHQMLVENPEEWNPEIKGRIYQTARDMISLEDNFIDLAFGLGPVKGIDPKDVKLFIRWVCDRRLNGLGLHAVYNVPANPFPWLSWILNAQTHTNFFEQRPTEYGKSSLTGWAQAYAKAKGALFVYTKSGCSYCERAKKLLDRSGYSYVVYTLDDEQERKDFYEHYGVGSMPQIFEGDWKHVGGYDNLVDYLTGRAI